LFLYSSGKLSYKNWNAILIFSPIKEKNFFSLLLSFLKEIKNLFFLQLYPTKQSNELEF